MQIIEITIRVFGMISDITGKTAWTHTGAVTTDDLNVQLLAAYPKLHAVKYSIALNEKLIHENKPLRTGDIVALLPPFSGG